MKIILSRKGVDQSKKAGNMPSPILNLGSAKILVSIPIPSRHSNLTYHSINVKHRTGLCFTDMGRVLVALGKNQLASRSVHLDPDLDLNALNYRNRHSWRPAFGQANQAAAHLRANVEVNDLFLFFGWFREARQRGSQWDFVGPDLHVIFGWLQVECIAEEEDESFYSLKHKFPAIAQHPHLKHSYKKNTVYVAAQKLKIPHFAGNCPGGGFFPNFDPKLVLTDQIDASIKRSKWRLRGWGDTGANSFPQMTYHGDLMRWGRDRDDLTLETVGIGQEFVTRTTPNILRWAAELPYTDN